LSKPYSIFNRAKGQGVVVEVERERGVRIVELDPALGWYSVDYLGGRIAPASQDQRSTPVN
jgi:hypothetical protein